MFAPPKIVALRADDRENNAPIVIRIKPKSPRNGLAAMAKAFSCALIISVRGRFPMVTRDIKI
ncbi:hypothetical protein ADICYQ_0794 [Cyclobacterium qasimii M12-11B]|uniref:Uncharacterized protein n=1 Tax=Cyclobacterium qasimii M12-11B TaxID=641524 RepID=S7VL97_9BACT|nr:hypothetical protein ADICYQ_0794 [Cyclobacterium qasimii M12-11B]